MKPAAEHKDFLNKIRIALAPFALEKVEEEGVVSFFNSDFYQNSGNWNDVFFDFDKKINHVAEHFSIEKGEYIKAVLKQPQLFATRPETLIKNIEGLARYFSIEKGEYIKAVLKQPQLFYQKPETLIKNIEDVAEHFNIETGEYIKAALKQPSLFTQKPETLIKNIEDVAEHFNIEKGEYIKAALKQPPLFTMKQETIIGHINLFIAIYKKGDFALPEKYEDINTEEKPEAGMLSFLCNNPALITLSPNNVIMRHGYALDKGDKLRSSSFSRKKEELLDESPFAREVHDLLNWKARAGKKKESAVLSL